MTTVVTGNCGYTLAPIADDAGRDYVVDALCTVEQIRARRGRRQRAFDWMARRPTTSACSINSRCCATSPRSSVTCRCAPRCSGPTPRTSATATADEVARIAELVADGLRLGALGFSTDQVVGQLRSRRSARCPGQVCGDDELLAVARALGEVPGPGLFTMAPARR